MTKPSPRTRSKGKASKTRQARNASGSNPGSSLDQYRRKRNFQQTREPKGTISVRRTGSRFAVQMHDASHLHYDFRLELDGVLKSWAVPKGPSLDPADRRLAIQVEDHPLEYGRYEGTIPQGEYGGGTVMLWDRGTWVSREDAEEGYRMGKLKFTLRGKKLRGGWVLVRRGGRKSSAREKSWFLIKERDRYARSSEDYSVTDKLNLSVSTGRTMDEISIGSKGHKSTSKTTR